MVVEKITFYAILRSFNKSMMSIWGPEALPAVWLQSAACRILAALAEGKGGGEEFSSVAPSPRQQSSTSLTSPAIFRENIWEKVPRSRSSTVFLKTESRHTRFSMKTPGRDRYVQGKGEIPNKRNSWMKTLMLKWVVVSPIWDIFMLNLYIRYKNE